MAASAERVTGAAPQSHYSDLDRMLIWARERGTSAKTRADDIAGRASAMCSTQALQVVPGADAVASAV